MPDSSIRTISKPAGAEGESGNPGLRAPSPTSSLPIVLGRSLRLRPHQSQLDRFLGVFFRGLADTL